MAVNLISKFKPLFTNDTRYFVLTGGRGSAKSFHVADFTDKIERYEVENAFNVNQSDITNKLTDSKIIFKGIKTSSGNQTAALKSIQGVTTWVLDEAEEMVNEEEFDKIDESIRVKDVQNRVILVLNPSTKEHWIYRRFFEEASVEPGK